MSVVVRIPPSLQALAGDVSEITVAGATVGACLRKMVRLYPQLKGKIFTARGMLLKGINIFVNGANVFPEPLIKPVSDGDIVHVAYTVLGG
jgi:molybdopterin converting factor small subunit